MEELIIDVLYTAGVAKGMSVKNVTVANNMNEILPPDELKKLGEQMKSNYMKRLPYFARFHQYIILFQYDIIIKTLSTTPPP